MIAASEALRLELPVLVVAIFLKQRANQKYNILVKGDEREKAAFSRSSNRPRWREGKKGQKGARLINAIIQSDAQASRLRLMDHKSKPYGP